MLRSDPTKEELTILNDIQETNQIDITEHMVGEWIACRANPLYYILNYVYLPEIGGRLKYTSDVMHNKIRRVVRSIMRFHACLMMASRQLGKSSIAAALLSWASNFYPGNRSLILNMQKRYAQENLSKIKFIQEQLPRWMRFDKASRSEIKEYIELKNGSRIDTLYPSSTTPPDSIARSLTLPILYIDEVAFIPHIDKIYGAAQPTLTRAREQAKKNNYPYFIFATSTPNGVEGIGKFFADMWDKAMETDEFFYLDDDKEIEDWVEDDIFKQLLNDPLKNNFARVIYHWSEDPTKDEAWYNQQKKELNFDMRKIRQELDLQFVGGQHCIFDDDVLSAMESKHRVQSIYMKHGTKLELFVEPQDISTNDIYLVGVDTASSLKGCFNAIEIFSFKEFQQIAELKVKLGSLTKYSEVVESVFQWLYKIVGEKIVLCIENNSIGKATIEGLLYHPMDKDFSYAPFIPFNKIKEEYGIATTAGSKDMMVSAFQEYLLDNPKIIKSNDLIAQLHRLERSNSGTISSKFYTDLFMAACLAAYIRKTKYYELAPLVDYTAEDFEKSIISNVKSIVSVSQKNLANRKSQYLEHFDDEGTVLIEDVPKSWSFFGG